MPATAPSDDARPRPANRAPPLRVLIVQPEPQLARLWARHLERGGAEVRVVHRQAEAIDALRFAVFDVVVLDLVLPGGSAMAVADFASYARPEARVAVVTSSSFFSDGSIFAHMPNACGFVAATTPPEDLAAMIEHWGTG